MPRRPVPLHAVRTLFLQRQHLTRPRADALTPGRLQRFVEDVGGLQLDSINVLDRAHYLTVWSRFGPYDRTRLDRLVYRRRLLFEYWAHAACLVSIRTLPWWRRAMFDYRTRHTGWSDWLRRITKDDPERRANALEFQRVVDKLFSLGGVRGEDDDSPIKLARRFRELAGFADEEIDEIAGVSAEARAEMEARIKAKAEALDATGA